MIISTLPGWQRWLLLSVKRARGSVRTWRFATEDVECQVRRPLSKHLAITFKSTKLEEVLIGLSVYNGVVFHNHCKIIPITCCCNFVLAKTKKKRHFIADQHVEFLWFTSPAPVVVEHLVAATHGWRSLPGGERHLLVMRTIAEGKLIYSISCITYIYMRMYINVYMHVRVYMCILYANIYIYFYKHIHCLN